MLERWIAVALVISLILLLVGMVQRRPRPSAPLAVERLPGLEENRQAQLAELGYTGLDLIDEAVLLLDGERQVIDVNRAARELVGVEKGRPLIEALRDHDLENLLRRSIAQGEQQSATVQLSRPQRVVRAMVRPVPHVGIVMVLRDLTELRHLQQVRRELVANVSHELRTPLATLQLLVETLTGGAADDEEARTLFLGKLHEQVAHMSEIVEQSLALAAMETGEARMMLGPVSVRGLMESCMDRLTPQVEQAGLRMTLEMPEALPCVRADFDQVSRVITNVLDNAIKVTPRGGELRQGRRSRAAMSGSRFTTPARAFRSSVCRNGLFLYRRRSPYRPGYRSRTGNGEAHGPDARRADMGRERRRQGRQLLFHPSHFREIGS